MQLADVGILLGFQCYLVFYIGKQTRKYLKTAIISQSVSQCLIKSIDRFPIPRTVRVNAIIINRDLDRLVYTTLITLADQRMNSLAVLALLSAKHSPSIRRYKRGPVDNKKKKNKTWHGIYCSLEMGTIYLEDVVIFRDADALETFRLFLRKLSNTST